MLIVGNIKIWWKRKYLNLKNRLLSCCISFYLFIFNVDHCFKSHTTHSLMFCSFQLHFNLYLISLNIWKNKVREMCSISPCKYTIIYQIPYCWLLRLYLIFNYYNCFCNANTYILLPTGSYWLKSLKKLDTIIKCISLSKMSYYSKIY